MINTIESPRVLLLSHRRLRPSVCRTSQNEYEDVVRSVDSVDLVCPRPRARDLPKKLQRVEQIVSRRAGIDFERHPWPQIVSRNNSYELLFVVVQHPSNLSILDAIPGWRQHCRKAIVFIEELWTVELKYEKMLQPLKQFDYVLCGHQGTIDPLQKLIGVPCLWEGVATDTLRFNPAPQHPKRVIDVLSMGRRSARTHRSLLKMAQTRDFYYEYDTVKAKHVLNSQEHRRLLAERIKRSRYFLVNTPKVDAQHQRGDQEEIGMRFYEGAAAGAVMIGQSPKTPSFADHFGWEDACIDLPYDSAEIADLIDSLEQQPIRVARARRNNLMNSLRRHDWAHRFARILSLANLEPHSRLLDRLKHLKESAALIESQSEEQTSPVNSRIW